MMAILSVLAFPLSTASADILYVGHLEVDGDISVVDTTMGTLPDPIPPVPIPLDENHIPTCIAFTPDGTQAYVTTLDILFDPGDVVVIDTATVAFRIFLHDTRSD